MLINHHIRETAASVVIRETSVKDGTRTVISIIGDNACFTVSLLSDDSATVTLDDDIITPASPPEILGECKYDLDCICTTNPVITIHYSSFPKDEYRPGFYTTNININPGHEYLHLSVFSAEPASIILPKQMQVAA